MPPRLRPGPKSKKAAGFSNASDAPAVTPTPAASASPPPYQMKIKPAVQSQPKAKATASSVKAAVPSTTKGKNEKKEKVVSPMTTLVNELMTSDSSDDDEPEKTKNRTPVSVRKKSPEKKSIELPKKSPAKNPRVVSSENDSKSEDSDAVRTPKKASSTSKVAPKSKAIARKTLDTESDEESSDSDEEVPEPSTRSSKTQQSLNASSGSRKNLISELDKAKTAVPSKPDSDDDSETTFESLDEDEDEEEDENIPTGNHKGAPKNKVTSENPTKKRLAVKRDDIDEDILEGEKIIRAMSDEDLLKLITSVNSTLSVVDAYSVGKRMSLVKWDAIAFDKWDAEACRKACAYLRYKRRTRRNMWEVFNEIEYTLKKNIISFRRKVMENSPDYPKKPPGLSGALNMYTHVKYTEIRDNNNEEKINYIEWYKTMVSEFSNLPESEKAYWKERSEAASAEYKKALEEFYAQIPGLDVKTAKLKNKSEPKIKKPRERKTSPPKIPKVEQFKDAPKPPQDPMEIFSQSKLSKLKDPPLDDEKEELVAKFSREWHELKNSKKCKWIDKVINAFGEYNLAVEEYKKSHPTYHAKPVKLANILTKGELALWETSRGKPEKPPATPNEVYEKDLEEAGELAGCTSDAERKALVDSKWNKLTFYEKECNKTKQQQLQLEYCKNICDFYATLPEFLRATYIASLDRKYRKYITNVEVGATKKSPKKRKADSSAEAAPSTPKKSRSKKNVPALNVEEVVKDIEETAPDEELHTQDSEVNPDPDSESSGKKKKKKKNKRVIDEVIRGIFDARQSLGRQFSAFYYYALYVAKTKVWIERIDTLGVYEAALLIKRTFIELDEHQKKIFVTHSYDHYSQKYYGVKPQSVKDMPVFNDDHGGSFRYPGEPVAPPINGKELYRAEIRKQRQAGSYEYAPDWKDLKEETQQVYMKKLYTCTKAYVEEFEDFIAKMTPNDILQYSVAKSRLWEKNLNTNLHRQRALKEFTFPLPSHEISDDDDDTKSEIISDEDDIHKIRKEMTYHAKGMTSRNRSVLDTNAFLAAILEGIEDE